MFVCDVRLIDVVELLPTAVILLRDGGEIESCNGSARELLGLTGHERGVQIADKLAEPDDAVRRYLRLCGRNLSAMPGRFTLLGEGGSKHACRFSGARIRGLEADRALILLALEELDSAAQQQKFVGLNEKIEQLRLEIHARQRAEALLEAEKATLASVVNRRPLEEALGVLCNAVQTYSAGMLVSVLLLDRRGRLHHAAAPSLPAEYLAAIDGLEIGPAVGSCGTAAFTGRQVIVSDIATDPLWDGFRDLAASAGLAACWSSPIRASTGRILGTLALYHERPHEPSVEQLKLIEASVHVAAVAIERHRALERESRLLAKTRKERERAKAEGRAKDMFLSTLSHELRNPLSAIANSANALAAREDVDDIGRDLQQIIINETRLLKRLVDDLLDMTRLRESKLKLQPETFGLEEFLDDLRAALVAGHPDRDIVFDIDDVPGSMHADRARIRQLFQNLLDNALKYSPSEKTVHLEVRTSDDTIRASVRDSGEGIAAELLPRIFEPFVQSDLSLARSRSGLGLGLALAKRICEMHGGTIAIRSDGLGSGSEAVLELPRGAVESLAVTRPDPPARAAAKRVLLVEDNDAVRTALSALLSRWGHTVCCAADGGEALEIIASRSLDIAFVDIGLPTMDGYEVAKAVRGDANLNGMRLVALTGYGQESDRQRVRNAGFDNHLTKPASPRDLIRLLAG